LLSKEEDMRENGRHFGRNDGVFGQVTSNIVSGSIKRHGVSDRTDSSSVAAG
jgi:hypothetical protein